MPPLIEKWNVLKDTDKDLFPLLEVMIPLLRFDDISAAVLYCRSCWLISVGI